MKMREFIISKWLWDEWIEMKTISEKERSKTVYRKDIEKIKAYNKQYRLDKLEEVKRKQREAYQRKKLSTFTSLMQS